MTLAGTTRTLVDATASMVVLLCWTLGVGLLQAQGTETPYPRMAPIEQYLMDRDAEIALARSAAPVSIAVEATVLVLGRHGYETGVTGKNGFVCLVERGWVGALDWPERWNPRTRGADCLNPAAARSILPIALLRTDMVLAGRSRLDIVHRLKTAIRGGVVPPLEPGAMSYMMSRGSYLTDQDHHNLPHLMFYVPLDDAAAWGAGLPGSPVGSGPFWFFSESSAHELDGFPPIRVFTVEVGRWSDGTAAQ